MVGMERKNENSKADARDMPASCPAVMVDMERDVPGNTADKIWQAPIQIAWQSDMSSIFQVCTRPPALSGPAVTACAFQASTIHITMPPSSSALPMMER